MLEKLAKFSVKGAGASILALTHLVFAQGTPSPVPGSAPITDIGGVQNLLCNILGWVFTFFIILAIFFVLWAGWNYLTAGGDAEKVKTANHRLIYAVVAIVIAVVARGIPLIINSFVSQGSTNIVACP